MPETARSRKSGSGAFPIMDAATAYVPRILLEQLAAHPDRPAPWGEWVDGTLVMADVSGFTALSERLAQAGKEGAEWLTEVIDRFFGRMLDIAWDCGGTTLTFGGDAILLLFYGEDHERRGIAAALRMLHGTQQLPALHVGNHHVKLSMSMGAHAGRFLTASAGTPASTQYLILGPETAKTAQAEARASSGELAVTAALAERVGKGVVVEPLDDFFRVERLVDAPRYRVGPAVTEAVAPEPETLAPYLPPFVSDALRADPTGPVPLLDHEHRNVTVVFVNVLGVDDILAADGPEALVSEVQRYLEPVVRLVEENHGYLISNDIYTNGFKLIVGFGVPAAHERDAENAFRFAARLRDEIASAGLRLTHRIGVNGGFVFAGDIGPAYRRQYTVMGDAVNLSARLMGAAQPGQIIVSVPAAEVAGDCFEVRGLDPIRVKGKEQPIDVGLLEGECEPQTVAKSTNGGFFGREEELATLAQARDSVEAGSGRDIVIRGGAGMGKSRLTAEFVRPLADRGWTVCTGRAYRHTIGQPFAPWLQILSSTLGLSSDDTADDRSRKTLAAIEQATPSLLDWAPVLDPLLHLDLAEGDFVRSFDAATRRERMFDLLTALLAHEAEARPLLLHMEDAHWADGSSLALAERIAAAGVSRRILLLLTERIEGAPTLDFPALATRTLDLTELPRDAAVGLVADALGRDLPRAAVDILFAKTKGNPLFLQEVANSIARSGIAAGDADEHELVRRLAEIDVPDRVQALLMSQIDALPVSSRDVLRTAAVVGTTFPVSTLRGAFSDDIRSDDLEARLSDLVTGSLLVDSTTGRERTFDFRHALIQEVAYESLPFAKRRDLHHRVGEYLEESNREAPQAVYESLVHHYRSSGDRDKTRVFAVKAGDKAQGLLANEEAIDYYRIGIEATCARTPAAAFARSYLTEQVADCLFGRGRYGQAADAYHDSLRRCLADDSAASEAARLLDLAQIPPARSREALLCHRIAASITRTHRDYPKALGWLERAIRALPAREPLLRAGIDATKGVALMWTGRYEESVRLSRGSLAIARRLGDRTAQCRAAAVLAQAYQDLGDLPASVRYRRVALELARELGDLPSQAVANSEIAASYICQGNTASALHHTLEALKIDERTGDLTGMGITRANLAEILIMQGRYDEAIGHLKTAIDSLTRAGGAPNMMGLALMLLARAHTRSGRNDEAAESLDRAVAVLKRSGATTFLAEARLQRVEILLASGDLPAALEHCEKGLAEARALGMRLMEIRGLWLRGRIAGARGELDAARSFLRASEELARRSDASYEGGLAVLALAEIDAAHGRPYRRTVARALKLLEPTGAIPDIERARCLAFREGPHRSDEPARKTVTEMGI